MASKKVVLVAGAQGVIGYAAATYMAALPDTQVYGLSRRSMGQPAEGFLPVNVDLLSSENTERALASLKDVTHVVFGAYVEKNTPVERSEVNVALLRNLLATVERHAPGLQHVTLYQGGKAYGADLGPFKTPAREDDPRLMSPNFYYDQEDFLKAAQQASAGTIRFCDRKRSAGTGQAIP